MSWAARRTTTREEDSAYCLLGIFDVNMPLLYGEGSKAFLCLQEEIMRTSTDLSILLWQGDASATNGMLAATPLCFEDMKRSHLDMMRHRTAFNTSQGWDTNNAGVSVRLVAYPYLRSLDSESIICAQIHENFGKSVIGIFLQKLSPGEIPMATASYRRIAVHGKTWVELDARSLAGLGLSQQLFITRQALADYTTDGFRRCRVVIQPPGHTTHIARHRSLVRDYHTPKNLPILIARVGETDTKYRFNFKPVSAQHLFGHMVVTLQYRVEILVCFGCDRESRAICLLLPFCAQLYGHGVGAADLLNWSNALCSDPQSDGINVRHACEFFAVSSNDNLIGSSRELDARGIHLTLDGGVFSDLYCASLSIEPGKFLKYYFGSEGVRLDEGKLAEYEQQLNASRRDHFQIADCNA
jgi:hypothetical protein